MSQKDIHAVTGAFGYSGKYITSKLLEMGKTVITLTNSPNRPNPFGERVKAFAFNFDNPSRLAASLAGVKVLYNTYWVRFNHQDFTHAKAVENSRILFEAAARAGVERVVHISITNPDINSPLEYFRGKAQVEQALEQTGVSHAIIRLAVLFGGEDILVNNIAWTLRTFPLFGIFGDGSYRLEPIYVDDLAEIAVAQGQGRDNVTLDAVGPESFSYRELVEAIAGIIGRKRPIIQLPVWAAEAASRMIGYFVNDVLVTPEEIEGLMNGLLYTGAAPMGNTRLTNWARDNADALGRKYASELARRLNREESYERL
ncbi:MAG: NAD-dependent epimerase/dehydratase family protein [Nitrospinota bacterium]|nr:NAD-dependent epimerase/dehydratase family protein [Nitrospinota bacterium]